MFAMPLFNRAPQTLVSVAAAWFALVGVTVTDAQAQTTSTGGLGGNLSGIQDLLNQAGLGDLTSGAGNTGGLTSLGNTGGFSSTGTTGTGGLTGTGGGTGRSPIITAQNQFIAHRGSALAAPAPGQQIKTAIAVHNGDTSMFTNAEPTNGPGFFLDAFQQIILTLIDSLNQGLSSGILGTSTLGGLGGLGSLGGFGNLGGTFTPGQVNTPNLQSTVGTIPNAATSGQGTVEQIQ